MLSFYGSVRASKARAWANNRRRSLRAQIATHLGDPSEDTVLVVGGGYLGSRAGVGSKVTPVLQCLLRELSKTWRVVVVDEVTRLGCSRARARASASLLRSTKFTTTTSNFWPYRWQRPMRCSMRCGFQGRS